MTKYALSTIALLAGLTMGGSAFAQTQVGNNDVSEADLPYVQQHCDALLLADVNDRADETTTPDGATTEAGDDADSGSNIDADGVPTTEPTGTEVDTAARNSSTTVDLDTITLDDCRAAGLVE
jgi:hypothetical protein